MKARFLKGKKSESNFEVSWLMSKHYRLVSHWYPLYCMFLSLLFKILYKDYFVQIISDNHVFFSNSIWKPICFGCITLKLPNQIILIHIGHNLKYWQMLLILKCHFNPFLPAFSFFFFLRHENILIVWLYILQHLQENVNLQNEKFTISVNISSKESL